MSSMFTWQGLSLTEMEAAFASMGEKQFRGRQMADWIYKKAVDDIASISSFSHSLRAGLQECSTVGMPSLIALQESARDPVHKALLGFADGETAECVLMRFSYGNSVCISTQIGCRMGCVFCASGKAGFSRNITAGEMIGQILAIRKAALVEGRISHIVVMGMGEPLDNLDELLAFLHIANAPWGLGIGFRHITVSTLGLISGMEKLCAARLPLNLSVSLHATDDTTRKKLMPATSGGSIKELLAAIKRYTYTLKRRVTIEYGLISGVNDSSMQARELASLLKGMLVHVNLIPINQIEASDQKQKLQKSGSQAAAAFCDLLTDMGITATLRREMGADIAAACGQLKRSV